tara:strand:+ start:25132 stop:25275 length:144 start_codon:yes stop_codon:yes gene_type:complete
MMPLITANYGQLADFNDALLTSKVMRYLFHFDSKIDSFQTNQRLNQS